MKNKILLLIVVLLGFIYYNLGSKKEDTSFFIEEEKDVMIRLLDTSTNEYIEVLEEDYLIGVVSSEMPASFEMEALKAQAVAARSYARFRINNNLKLTNDSSTQNYITVETMKNKWNDNFDIYYNKIKDAVILTENEVITFNGEIIPAYYFSMSNGYTEDSINVFKSERDYLKSVESPEDESINNFMVTKVITKDEFCNLLNISCDSINITSIDRNETQRVNSITINGITFEGTKFRKLLSLRSTDFDLDINDDIYITTKGHGHGVGMSQYGANNLAKKGYKYKDILKYYYQNTDIISIN